MKNKYLLSMILLCFAYFVVARAAVVQIGALCPDGTYSWSHPTIFTTRSPMTIPFHEEFADGSTAIPEGWARYIGLLSEVMAGTPLTSTNSAWSFSNYNHAFNGSFHACTNIYGKNRKHWLVTPEVSMSGDCLLSFDLAYTAYDGFIQAPETNGSDDKFVVLISTDYGNTWQILRQWDNAGSAYVLNDLTPEGKTIELDLSAYTNQTVQVAFYAESTVSNADNNLHIDNVNIDVKPLCWDIKVQDITLSNITPHSVTVSWTPTGATLYDVQCCVADDFNTMPFYDYATSSNSYTFGVDQWNDPLDPETQYYVRVAPNCPDGGYEPWSEVITFTTPEICPAPYNVTIDSVSAHGFWASFTPADNTQDSWEYTVTTSNYPPDDFPGNTTYTTFGYINSSDIHANTTYYLWIGVYCEEDQSFHVSEPAEFTTLEACFPPTNLVAHTTPNSATITWTPSQPGQNHWTVELLTPDWGDYPWTDDVDEPIITFDAETLNGLLGEGEDCYGKTFRVRVYSECGEEDGTSQPATLDFVVTENDFITVYDGTANNNRIPAYIFYFDDFTKSQFIIPAEDLSALIGNSINSLTFYSTNSNVPYTTESSANVYLKEVNYTSIDAFEPMEDATTVYSGYFNIVSANGGGQLTITFDQPYYYQGGNLLVGIENTEDIDFKQIHFYGQEVANASISGSNGSSLDDVPAEQQNFIPKTTFGYIPTCDVFSAFSLPYTYGFEDADELDCWTMLNCDNNTGIYTEAACEGNNGFRFYYNTNPPQYLISPKLDATTYVAVSFYYRNSSDTYPETFQVGYSTTTKSPNAFIWHDEVTAADQATWKLYNNVFPAGTKYVAVKYNSYDQLRLFLDNFSFIPETCPTPSNIHVTDIAPTQATLNWDNGEDNDTWVAFRRAGQHETAYYESFEHEIDFYDWSTVNMGTSENNANELGRSTETAKTGMYSFKFTSYFPDDNGVYDQYLISPNVSEWQSKIFRFDYKNSYDTYERFKVGFSSTDTNIESFTWGDEIVTNQTGWQTYQATIPANAVYIAIHYCSNYSYDFYVDDFTILTGNYIPATDWYGFWATSPLTITEYYPAWGPVMYLEPNTKYEFQMITACDGGVDQGGSDSDWTEVMSFTTLDDGFKVFVAEGDWSTDNNWSPAGAPSWSSDVIIRADADIPNGCVAYANSITYEGSPMPTLTIKDGGQLRTNNDVEVTVEKIITGYGSGNGKYYLISNPLWEDVNATDVEGLISSNATDYDLYSFDPEGQNNGADDEYAYREWRNYKASPFLVEFGYGYLYANKENDTLRFTGNAIYNNYGGRAWSQQYDEDTEAPFGNWFLTGNFYTCNCYLVYANENNQHLEANFYVMNEAGTDLQLSETQASLGLCEGAFIEKPSDGRLCYMTYDPGLSKSGILNITLTQGEGEIDQARIRFGEGYNLGKLSLREKSTISIPQNGKDFAVVYTDNRGEMPVSFKALTDGTFTMSFSNEEVNFCYLHLIDNLTDEDIDLLANPSYTFEGRTSDNNDRFKVVFVTTDR